MVKLINKIADAVLGFLHLSKFKEQIMYLGVGVLTTLVDWAVYALFVLFVPSVGGEFLKAISPNILSYSIAWLAAVIFSYVASKTLVFKPTDEKVSTQFLKFFGSRAITLALSIAGDIFLSGEYALVKIENPFIAKLIISVAIIIINYITSKWLVFTKKSPNGEEK
ncbi:MAG: GtrA family protein [Clostridia bacterium]|nr:GtrA family protein [Clostridia bacterium]